ncbi:MAG: prolyl oligopeptidase family serine peptidase [Kangiella sp.]|nr:prolyl oligopeptidase family serine peptidase [Kangiella sp.]
MTFKNTLLTLAIIVFSISVQAKLVKSNEIFTNPQFNNFVISPSGQTFIGKSYLDGFHQLFAFQSTTNEAAEIFKLQNSGSLEIIDYNWIDSDTAYVTFKGNFNKYYTRFIDFTFKEDTFDIDYFDVEAIGFVINPMSTKDNRALYAKLNSDDEKFDLLEIDIEKLKSVKATKKNHQKVFDSFRNLSDGLDNTFEFFVSNKDYQLEMIGQYFEDYNTYSIYDLNTDSWREFFRVNKNTNEDKNYSRLDIFEPVGAIDERFIVALSNMGRDKTAVIKFDASLKKEVDVLYESNSYDIKSATFDTIQNKLTSVTYVDRGVKKQKFLDKPNQALQKDLHQQIGLDSIFIIDSSLNNNDLVIFAYDSTHPGKFYHYNQELGKLRFLQNEMPDLHPYTFRKGRLLTAKNELDNIVEGFLFLPEAPNKHPLVVMPHGGPIGVQDRNEFDQATQFLVNRGYAVLTINFRGSAGYGKEYMNAGREQFGEGIEADINLLTQKAFAHPSVDKNNACIYGTSYGGYSAVTSTIIYPQNFKCAITAFGVFDLPLLFSATNLNQTESRKDAISFIVGDIDADYNKLKANSPLYKASQIKVPTLIFSGLRDEIAHPEHSRRLNYVLTELGNTEVQYHEYTLSGHGHRNWRGDIHQYVTIVEFLDRHIGKNKSYPKDDHNVLANDNFNVGMIYYNGTFVEKDTKQAERYLKLAHKYGDDRAAQYLRRLGIYNF